MNQTIRSYQTTIQAHPVEKNRRVDHFAAIIPIDKHKIKPAAVRHSRIAVKTNDAVHFINVDEIIRCISDNNYCTIFYGKGLKVMVAKTLKAVSALLPLSEFLRVHNSHVVRLDTIHLVYADHIVLYTGDKIPLSRITKKELLIQLSSTTKFL